jgi:hypothetical protein
MISKGISTPIKLLVIFFAGLMLVSGAARAETVNGTVNNGTSGTAVADAEVLIINPSAGMAPVQTVKAVGGRFTVENLDAGVYIARASYGGVTYNHNFQIPATGGSEPVEVAIVVYEPTTSWGGVRIVVPHFTAARHADHLVIERVYDIYNESNPPRTVTGEDGSFRFPLPGDMHSLNGFVVSYSGIPIERQPLETGEAGVWSVDYPIRPGVTRVGMAYTLPYDSVSYTMNEKIHYDIESITIFATDVDMTIHSHSHELAQVEGPHASVSWAINGLKKGQELNLHFQGGADQQVAAAGGGSQPAISVVPNSADSLSTLMMAILLLALMAFAGIALREPHAVGAEALHLKEYRDVLVGRLAKLDDLNQTGAIPAAAYQSKRAELKNQIASLMYRLNASGGSGTSRAQQSDETRSGTK